jgi:hypothetical protein
MTDADAHVCAARKLFRDCGFTLAAMQFPRPAEALTALKRFNGLPDDAKVPPAWHYFPNAHMRDNWRQYYGAEQ